MVLSLNEIRKRAIAFSHEWKEETSEKAESQTFWNDFFNIFGVSRRRVASFEKMGHRSDGGRGFIDLFWKGKLVVEHKSKGSDLDKAYSQALDYFAGLNDSELPRYVIVTDFARFRVYDLDVGTEIEFPLDNLVNNISSFYFIPEHRAIEYEQEDPVNIQAAELMGKLHDALKENGYRGHELEILLVRLVFNLFADNTNIFKKGSFRYYIENKTNSDGTDVGVKLISIFEVLNTIEEKRQKNLDEDLNIFPYIDGSLFLERISIPSFDRETREIFIECCSFNWSSVSPAIFGSMFQSVMNPDERHDLGAHYTSEKNILKTIDGLFLNELKKEFSYHHNNRKYLEDLLKRIGKIKILDPACGCGNFLIISYRELRRLQIEIRKQIWLLSGFINDNHIQNVLNIQFEEDLNVDSMYGIEYLEFPARIAQVGLWLMDHIVNMELSKEFGIYYVRLPLTKTANVHIGNALSFDWNDLVKKKELTYIIGNPPFISKHDRNKEQKRDMDIIFSKDVKNYGLLDYVCCWYKKACDYIDNTDISVSLVSTNSITQGEQVGILWSYLLKKNIIINFAHRTFEWYNDAKGKAQVYVVIIGFSQINKPNKLIYEYEKPNSEPIEIKVNNINPFLVNQRNILIINRSNQLCEVPKITYGNMPNDNGNLLFTDEEKNDFLLEEPFASKYIRRLISAKEYLNNTKRWCLWLKDLDPSDLNKMPKVKERIRKVKEYREKSKREATRKLAEYPYLFGEIRQTDSNYVCIPLHTSENRKYIPMAFFSNEYIANNSCSIIPNAETYHFGVLSSAMHMAWVNQICGRIKSDYRYSNKLVYNNFPWPQSPSKNKIIKVEQSALEVLKVRDSFNASLADLYNPLTMPKKLYNAHKKLDKAVDGCYRRKSFKSEMERLSFLFELYETYNNSDK